MNQAHAGVMTTAPTPDIYVAGLWATYDGSEFVSQGEAMMYKPPLGDDVNILPDGYSTLLGATSSGVFEMRATITADGAISDASFTVHGSLGTASTGEVVLLRGTVTEMNMAVFSTSRLLEFKVTDKDDVTGVLAPMFQSQYGGAVIKMTLQSWHYGVSPYTFTDAFGATGAANIGRPVPEPASMAIWGSVLVVGSVFSRRRNRNRLAV
tara:strand:+ start:3386 stop:4012 length:627 start_codon:yes stop_codon:yes gene_type:complete